MKRTEVVKVFECWREVWDIVKMSTQVQQLGGGCAKIRLRESNYRKTYDES